jgi:hypothetical protein
MERFWNQELFERELVDTRSIVDESTEESIERIEWSSWKDSLAGDRTSSSSTTIQVSSSLDNNSIQGSEREKPDTCRDFPFSSKTKVIVPFHDEADEDDAVEEESSIVMIVCILWYRYPVPVPSESSYHLVPVPGLARPLRLTRSVLVPY